MNRIAQSLSQPLRTTLRTLSRNYELKQNIPTITVPFASFHKHSAHPIWAFAKPVKDEKDLFDVFFKGFSSKPFESFFGEQEQSNSGNGNGNGNETEVWRPRADVKEVEDAAIITVEMPGLSKEDVKIKIINNELIISGEKKAEKKDGQSSTVIERAYSRKFTIDEKVQASTLTAKMEHGILTIKVPHPKEAPEKVADIQIS